MTPSDVDTDSAAIDDAAIRRMASFAVMTVDWNGQRRSYLDNFLNYVLAVVPANSTVAFPREAVRPSIIESFNLTLPTNIVDQLVRRATRLGLLATVGELAISLTDKGKREVAPIPYTLKKLAQEQSAIAERFVSWIGENLDVALSPTRATSILLDYIETYYCSLMNLSDGDGSVLRLPGVEPTPEQKMAAAFVGAVHAEDEELFESIANLARGSIMVSALYAPKLVDTTRGFRHTTVYLDTKIIFRALGYEGEPAEQSTLELIQVLKRQGARLAVFDFTLREIRSVLDAVAQRARTGRMWDARPGTVESYFYRVNASNAQIEQHSVRIESKILGLGLFVDPSPSYENHRFVIDEHEVEAALLAGNPNYRPTAVKHDVELIAAMVRARRGRARDSLEESRATFVTLNSLVVRTAHAVQRQYRETWPLVMFESDIAALTWVKEPLAAPNLPRNQLLATSLGLTNPGKQDWALYIAEIGRLLDSEEITDNDLILLRQKYEMDRIAFVNAPMQGGAGARKQAVRASVEQARDAVRAELTAPIQAEKLQLELDLSESERVAGEQRAEADHLLGAVLRPLWRAGATIKWSLYAVTLALCVGALLVTFVPEWATWIEELPGGSFLLVAVRLVAAVAAVAGGLSGPFLKLGSTARRRFLLRALRKRKISPERAAEVGFLLV